MDDNEARLACLELVIAHHPELKTLKERLEGAEILFNYLDNGDIPEK